MDRIIIGLVGPIASGKGVISDFLINNGFIYEKLSDRVREETSVLGLELTRKNLQDVGNNLRKKFGNHILVKLTFIKHESDCAPLCIDGVRNPGELEYIKQEGGLMVGITATTENRLHWYLARAKERQEDGATEEVFNISNNRDLGIGETVNGQQVQQCLDRCDYVIENSGTKAELIEAFAEIISHETWANTEGVLTSIKEK